MPKIELTKGEKRDVEIAERALRRLEDRGISLYGYDSSIYGLRATDDEEELVNGLPNQDLFIFTISQILVDTGGF